MLYEILCFADQRMVIRYLKPALHYHITGLMDHQSSGFFQRSYHSMLSTNPPMWFLQTLKSMAVCQES
jgi:hypothetical protein